VACSAVGYALQWVSPHCDLQWVYVGLRWVCGGGFDLRWPFSGSGCVSCLLGRVYFTGWLCLPWIVRVNFELIFSWVFCLVMKVGFSGE
jgi:hypothetical protein